MKKIINLPLPKRNGGMPMMSALNTRQSIKEFSSLKELTLQQLSDLLWSMFGINRENTKKRTAPSAKNWQEITLYVIKPEGTYIYNPFDNILELVIENDIRQIAGIQEYSKQALLNIFLVADLDKIEKLNNQEKMITASLDAGFISQNAYLYCAAEKLACVARLMIDRENANKMLQLKENQWIAIALTVGNLPESLT